MKITKINRATIPALAMALPSFDALSRYEYENPRSITPATITYAVTARLYKM